MNNILQLKGRFEKRKNDSGFGPAKLPAKAYVTSDHLLELKIQLDKLLEFWKKNTDLSGALISVHYSRVVAKSNRLRILLGDKGKKPVDSIRGARFVEEYDSFGMLKHKHVFTHYVQLSAIEKAIENLEIVERLVTEYFKGKITDKDIELIGKTKGFIYDDKIKKTNFVSVILDAYYVEEFTLDSPREDVVQDTIVTIYRTDIETKTLLKKFGIDILNHKIIDGTTLLLDAGQMQTLYKKAPYLIAMEVADFTKLTLDDIEEQGELEEIDQMIPHPHNEPVVGVIDTQFNEKVYFHEWVEYTNMLPADIELEKKDYSHGTAVSYIIVDGPKGNPDLDDGCGRFRVRHFGVSTARGFSSFEVLRNIREIVSNNRDIQVWNLSLGSPESIKRDFISPEAAELDRIQSEYDVIFVVAGTNKPENKMKEDMKIGSPADSLNALVVNSVTKDGKMASYSRSGPVLSFFHKPDLSYYGGDGTRPYEKIAVCINDMGALYLSGTSFAAPWITRKIAYLINVIGMSREVAKALLLDSAARWEGNGKISDFLGYGIVPQNIGDILHTSEDEIKFFITGTTEDYETYNYNLPIPVVNGKHPFYARAVLTYFPTCDRNQGVDYTSTEMDIHFGRVKPDGKLRCIDDNKQSEEGQLMREEEARNIYRKWDNVKRVCEQLKSRVRPRDAYTSGMWGLSILTKERVYSKKRNPMQFGVVITLKEMYGKNRIDEFVKNCMARGWLVNAIDVQNQIDIYTKAEEEIDFE